MSQLYEKRVHKCVTHSRKNHHDGWLAFMFEHIIIEFVIIINIFKSQIFEIDVKYIFGFYAFFF